MIITRDYQKAYDQTAGASRLHQLDFGCGKRHTPLNAGPGHDIRLPPIVRLQIWGFGKWELLIYFSLVSSDAN